METAWAVNSGAEASAAGVQAELYADGCCGGKDPQGANAHAKFAVNGTSREPVESAGIDVHLVMNTLNRLVGEPRAGEAEPSQHIFNLSDYLRLSMAYSAPLEVGIDQEIGLLDSYLQLATVFHGWTVDHSVRLTSAARGSRLPAHTLCVIAHALLATLTGAGGQEGKGELALRIGRTAAGPLVIDIALPAASPAANHHQGRLDHRLQVLCLTMSSPAYQWCHAISSRRDEGLDIQIQIS